MIPVLVCAVVVLALAVVALIGSLLHAYDQRDDALVALWGTEAENAMLRDARAAANKAFFDSRGSTR